MDNKIIEKFFCLDVFYCVVTLYLFFLIIGEKNILDVLYLVLFTFFYVKIKVARFKEKRNTCK